MSDLLGLREYQRECIDAIKKDWADDYQRVAAVLATGSGKAQPVDEPVLTPVGWKPIRSLSVGDWVIGSDGEPTRVTGTFPQGVRPTVTVRFTDKTEVRCDTDHLWQVHTRSMKHRDRSKVLTATEMIDKWPKSDAWYVPVVAPVSYAPIGELPVDPYTLGVLLGDGGLSIKGQVRLHTRHDIIPLLKLPGHRVKLHRDQGVMGNYLITGGPRGTHNNRLMSSLQELGLHGHTSHGKFVPGSYLRSSVSDRLGLLQGILDTDGSVSRNGADYATVSKRLAYDVADLVRSLGGSCTLSKKTTSWSHNGQKNQGEAYRCYITLPRHLDPFRVPRKKDARLGGQQFDPVKKVESIVPGPELECVCISVERPDQLYVTAGFTLTHNTIISAHLINETSGRTVFVVHRDELVTQAVDKIQQVAPSLSVGVVKAERDEHDADVVVASVQTLSRPKRVERLGDITTVICDEVHHAAAGSWINVLNRLGCFDPGSGVSMLGITATLIRNDGKAMSDVIEKVSYERDIVELIHDGYLVPVRGRRVRVGDLDLSSVSITSGDLNAGELETELDNAGAAQIVAKAYLEHASDRAGILFAPTVASAHVFAEALTASGIPAEPAWGDMPLEDRRNLIKRFTAGDVQVITNAALLGEGVDLPFVSCVVIARPTQSSTLFVQAAGRALRPHPGKTDALVLDIVGATEDHRLATLVDLSSRTRDVEIDYGTEVEEVDLLDAVDKLYSDRGKQGASGRMTYDEVDLFAASRSAWLQTHRGIWFVPTMDAIFFLWPNTDGTYRVAQRTKSGGYARLHNHLSLPYAMAWAEQYAAEIDSTSSYSISGRQAAWRKKKAKPTPSQIRFATEQGVELAGDEHRAELSDKISAAMASRYLDQWLKD